MDDDEAQARSGGDTAGVAGAGRSGRNPAAASDGAESATAARGRTKAEVATGGLMEQVVERGNMWAAYERVLRNKGAPGADGMRVEDLKAWLQAHWPAVKAALLAGSYLPREVRAVDIPKPQGGVRTLGVPSVVDRLVQQALLQVLQPIFEPVFSDSSYGFRPGRSAGAGGASRPRPRAQRPALGGGHGLGEILRPGQPRPADGKGGKAGDGRAGSQADPQVPGSRPDEGWDGAAENAGHAARRAAHAMDTRDNFEFERQVALYRTRSVVDMRRRR